MYTTELENIWNPEVKYVKGSQWTIWATNTTIHFYAIYFYWHSIM